MRPRSPRRLPIPVAHPSVRTADAGIDRTRTGPAAIPSAVRALAATMGRLRHRRSPRAKPPRIDSEDLIDRIVREAACPVIVLIHDRKPEFIKEGSKRGVVAHITDADVDDWQSSIDIVLRRFAEYHDLQGAFGRRALIERAKGILMERHTIDDQHAYELLREHSRVDRRRRQRARGSPTPDGSIRARDCNEAPGCWPPSAAEGSAVSWLRRSSGHRIGHRDRRADRSAPAQRLEHAHLDCGRAGRAHRPNGPKRRCVCHRL